MESAALVTSLRGVFAAAARECHGALCVRAGGRKQRRQCRGGAELEATQQQQEWHGAAADTAGSKSKAKDEVVAVMSRPVSPVSFLESVYELNSQVQRGQLVLPRRPTFWVYLIHKVWEIYPGQSWRIVGSTLATRTICTLVAFLLQ